MLRIALDVPLRRLYDYLPPDGVAVAGLRPGVRVEVPFGPRTLIGVLVEVAAGSSLPTSRLRAARAVLDVEPALDPVTFDLVRWAADYYHHPPGEALAAALPILLRTGRSLLARETYWQWRADAATAATGTRLGARQKAVAIRLDAGPLSASALAELGDGARAAMKGFAQ